MANKTIRIEREKLIDAIIWSNDPHNCENGYHGVHVQPWLFGQYEDDSIDCDVSFYQSGNEYSPETPHVCEFSVDAFLDEDAFLRDASWDDLEDSYLGLSREAIDAGEDPDEWADTAAEYLREVIANSLLPEIVCDGQHMEHESNAIRNYEHVYRVEYIGKDIA